METLILASLCVGAAGGMRLRVFVLFPMIILCLIVVTAWGLARESDRLVDHRDEFCWLSLPSTRLFGRLGAQLSHDCRSTKPTRALATGSPIRSVGDPSHSISPDRAALAFSLAAA